MGILTETLWFLWEGGTDLDIPYSVLMEFKQLESVMCRDEH